MSKPKYATGQISINLVPLGMLAMKPDWSPRYDYGDMRTLGASIKEQGVIMPLLVSKDKDGVLNVVDGGRRFKALKNLQSKGMKFDDVPVVLVKPGESDADLMFRFIHAAAKPLLPYEEAGAYARIQEISQGEADIPFIAARTGRSQAYVKDRLSLLKAVPTIVSKLKKGEISLAAVQRIVKVADEDAEKQNELLDKEMEDKGSTKEDVQDQKEETYIKRVKLKRENLRRERPENRITLKAARAHLADIVDAYSDLIQARLPINSNNRYWKALQKELNKARALKGEGALKV